MKFKILQSKLKEGVSITGKTAIKSISLPILRNIHLSVKDNFLSFTATDLEVSVRWYCLIKQEQEGETTIPLDIFSSFINLLPENEKVDISVKNHTISIECKDYKTKIKGLDPEDFPIIPEVKEGQEIEIKTNSFFEGLKQVADIPSASKVKPEISGVYFLLKENILKLVATDSYRLAEKTIFLEEKVKDEFSFILPQKAAKEVLNIFSSEETIKIKFDSNQVLFESKMEERDYPKIQLTSKVIEGEYPNYEAIIPKETSTEVLIEKDDFFNKIKAASLFSGKVNEVTLNITNNNEIKIFSKDNDLGEYETVVKAKIEGEPLDISFNHRFLRDGLSEIKSSEIVFSVKSDSSPAKITPVGKTDFLYVVMPIRNS